MDHRLGGGKIRTKKQWDAYQKLVAYYNQQRTVNALAESIDIANTLNGLGTTSGDKKASVKKRESSLELEGHE